MQHMLFTIELYMVLVYSMEFNKLPFQILFFTILLARYITSELYGGPKHKNNVNDAIRLTDVISDVIETLCIGQDTDRLVYRYRNDTHIFIGFDVIQDNVIFTMEWLMYGNDGELLRDLNLNTGGFDISLSHPVRQSLTVDKILGLANLRQQRLFADFLSECRVPGLTQSCLIEAFVTMATGMKSVKLHKSCVPRWRRLPFDY
ncbi:uncharacterized protein LOC127850781 isoform X4 [Dreissena polymorpha]|nr:uncharacterized protein LOC127850781 isoform X4 [Dreissena polymorpha]